MNLYRQSTLMKQRRIRELQATSLGAVTVHLCWGYMLYLRGVLSESFDFEV